MTQDELSDTLRMGGEAVDAAIRYAEENKKLKAENKKLLTMLDNQGYNGDVEHEKMLEQIAKLKQENEKLQKKYDQLISDLEDWKWVSGKIPDIDEKDITDSLKRIKKENDEIAKLKIELTHLRGKADDAFKLQAEVNKLKQSRDRLAERAVEETVVDKQFYNVLGIKTTKAEAIASWVKWSEEIDDNKNREGSP